MYLELDPYLKFHKNYKASWLKLSDELTNSLVDSDIKDELIPFNGTRFFDDFSEAEKKSLFYTYIQFNAEVIMFLERMLLLSFRSLRADIKGKKGLDGVLKFMGEELYHSMAFNEFLHAQNHLDYPNKKIVKLPFVMIYWLFSALKFAPLGVCFPAVKLEAYSLAYYNYLQKYYKEDENDWMKLNRIHAIDEIKHVPIHFEFIRLLEGKSTKTGKLRTIYSTFTLIICLQFVLFFSTKNMLKISVPRLSRFQRLRYTFAMFKWILRELPVYDETRAITKKCFDDNNPPLRKLFSFMHW